MFIDTHCHLDMFENLEEILNQSRISVSKFIVPTVNSKSLVKASKIAKENKDVFLAVGIHPEETKKENFNFEDEIKFYENFLNENHNDVFGIGECGLDLEKDQKNLINQSIEENTNLQIRLFKQQLNWAINYKKPIIIHNRRGNKLLFEIIKDSQSKKIISGVFHCYATDRKYIEKVMNLGFYFGLGGMITLDEGLQKVVKDIPLEKIVLETDSPFLTPKQARKDQSYPNLPGNIKFVAETLAQIKKVSLENIIESTNKNALSLFSLGF